MANEFIERIFFGGATSPSIYSVTGSPPFVGVTPNTGDLALSDAGYLYIWNGTSWILAAGGPSNNIPGIGTSVGNSIAVWDGTTGDLLKDSLPTIDAGGNLALNPGAGPTAAQLRFVDLLGTKYVALRGPNTIPGASFFMTLPQTDGAVNQVWKYDGTGNFFWDTGIFVGSSAGGSLTGTYPSPGIAAGAIGQTQIANGAVDIGQLNVNVTNNYLPSTGEKDAMAGTAGTPGPANAYVTQDGGTMNGPVTYNNVTNNVYNGGNTYNSTNTYNDTSTYSPTITNTVWNIVDQSTSNISVTQLSSGETQYTNPTNANQTAQVSGSAVTLIDNSKNTNVNIAGDSFSYVYNAAPPSPVSYFSYTLNQPIAVNVNLGTDGSMQFKETVAGNVGELQFSAIGSATLGNGVNLYSFYNLASAPLQINATSLRFTGDLAPNSLPGTSGEVLTSQGAGVPPIWTNVSLYVPSTNTDWSTPTPPTPAGSGTVPTATGEALDLLAAQNYARWQNIRTTRTDTNNSNVVVGLDQSISVILVDATAGNRTETLPLASALAGKYYTVKKIDSTGNTVTVARAGANTIDGQTSYVLGTQYSAITLVSDGTNWFTLDFQTTPGTAGQLLTSGGAGFSPTWTNQSVFTDYTPSAPSNWTTPTPVGPSPTTISGALNTLALQNYTRWVNYRTTESRLVSSNAIISDNSVSAIVVDATAGPVTITLPNVATWANKWFTVKKVDASANAVILASGGANIDGSANQSILYQYDAITVVSTGGTWYILDQIDSAPPVVATAINVSLNGSAVNTVPTFVGGFYVPTGSTFTTSSRVYAGINAAGTITVTIQNASNSTVATFTYVAGSSGFFDITLAAPVSLLAGWYNVILTASTASTTAFIRGLYLTV